MLNEATPPETPEQPKSKLDTLPLEFMVRLDRGSLNAGYRVYRFWRSDGKKAILFDAVYNKIVIPSDKIELPDIVHSKLPGKKKSDAWVKLIGACKKTYKIDIDTGHLLTKEINQELWKDWGPFMKYEGTKINFSKNKPAIDQRSTPIKKKKVEDNDEYGF